MSITVTGGIVSTKQSVRKTPPASPVDNIVFEDLPANTARLPINAKGVMILKNSYEEMKNGATLYYQDSNANNNAIFKVYSEDGLLKLKVEVIA